MRKIESEANAIQKKIKRLKMFHYNPFQARA